MPSLRIKRGSAAQLAAAAAASQLKSGELYLVEDQGRVAVGTGVDTFEPMAKQSEAGVGGASLQSATLSVSPAQYGQATINVAVALAAPGSLVLAQLMPNADWDADELSGIGLHAEPMAGQIAFTLSAQGPLVGDFKIVFQLT